MLLFIVSSLLLFGSAVCAQDCAQLPQDIIEQATSTLPDPFTFLDGRPVSNAEDWTCRRQELLSLFQRYELGELPGAPASLSASYSANTLTITPTVGSNTVTYSVSITYPSDTTTAGPYPALIAYGTPSIPVGPGIATITFDNSAFAQQQSSASRGLGLFYDLHGSAATASALTAWSWGVSRIIDALEITPGANIRADRIAVTGCSRNGKGAFVAGMFEERVALTIPQESGAGGTACWRLSDWQREVGGEEVQTAGQIVGENVWLSEGFADWADQVEALPYDHHEMAGMIAPRGLLVVDNPDFLWLGPWSSYGCMEAGRLVYSALGVGENLGMSSVEDHDHCSFPVDRQQPDLFACYRRFLLDEEADTDVFYSTSDIQFPLEEWVEWDAPSL